MSATPSTPPFRPHLLDPLPEAINAYLAGSSAYNATPSTIPTLPALTTLLEHLQTLSKSTKRRVQGYQRDQAALTAKYSFRVKQEQEKATRKLGRPKKGDGDGSRLANAHSDSEASDHQPEPTKKRKRPSTPELLGAPAASKTLPLSSSPGADGTIAFKPGKPDFATYYPTTSSEEHSLEEIRNLQNEQDKKRILGVAVYPTINPAADLPFRSIREEFPRPKPANQIASATFNATTEPFFRPFAEEDLSFLRERGDRLAPFIMPPLGDNTWEEGDHPELSDAKALKGGESITDDILETEEICCGPLSERVLSALLKEDLIEERETEGETGESANGTLWRISSVKADFSLFEERLQRELRYIGLLENEDVNWNLRQDDEVCATLRTLQKELQHQSQVNIARKKRLEPLVSKQMAWQEYSNILEDLDKQVEQAFLKRTRNIKAKKKRVVSGAGVDRVKPTIGDSTRAILERRKRWKSKLGHLFEPVEQYNRIPRESVFDGISDEIRDEDIDEGIDVDSGPANDE